jgi:hypothetical protein
MMDAIRQHVRVTFSFPVCFTTGVFDAGNPLLRELIDDTDDPAPADLVVVVDDGVAKAHAGLPDLIERYCAGHADVLRLAGPVLVVGGGEAAKNGPDVLSAIHGLIHGAALCRHSYVVAVGGLESRADELHAFGIVHQNRDFTKSGPPRGKRVVGLKMTDQRVEIFVLGDDVIITVRVCLLRCTDVLSEDQVQRVLAVPPGFHQGHLSGVFEQQLYQDNRQVLVPLPQHIRYFDRLARDPVQADLLDVLEINEDVVGTGHIGLRGCWPDTIPRHQFLRGGIMLGHARSGDGQPMTIAK